MGIHRHGMARTWIAHRLGCVRHLTLKIDVPATASVLREAASLDSAFNGPREPEAEAVPARGDRVVLQADVRGLRRFPEKLLL